MRHSRTYGDSPSFRLAILIVLATVLVALCSPHRVSGAQPAPAFDVAQVASQIGVSLPGKESGELRPGVAVTGSLVEPARLAAIGITGFHKGARVMIMRLAEDRLLIEADELDPTPRRATVKVKIEADGRLTRL